MVALGGHDRKTVNRPGVDVKDKTQLSIIIVNHLSNDVLGDCLNSIARSDHTLATEIIIVDNPLVPETGDLQIPGKLTVKRRSMTRRTGFGEACNAGAEIAEGDYLLFLNPDVSLRPSAIDDLFNALRDNPEAGLATGRLTDPDGTFQPTCRRFPTLGNLMFSRGSFFSRVGSGKNKNYTLPDYGEITPVEAMAAALILMPGTIFDKLGGFDTSFFMYMEDTDLCRRLADLRLKALYVPTAQGVHLWGHSTGKYRFRRIIWHHVSVWRYFVKHHRSPVTLLPLTILLPINCLLSLTGELFTLRS